MTTTSGGTNELPQHEQARLVQELRKRTGAGLMECKCHLKEAGWDLDKAHQLMLSQWNQRRMINSPTDWI